MSKDITEIVKNLSPENTKARVINNRRPVVKKGPESDRGSLPPIKKLSTLIAERKPLPPELVAGVLYKGSTMVYGGGSKTNKTFALMDLAVSVAAGVPWWNLKTTQGRVLYLDFELEEPFFVLRFDAIANAKGVPMEALENIESWNLRGKAADISLIVEEIIQRIKDNAYALIIIDPIYKILGDRDENSAGDINSLMNELDKIAVASGAAIVGGHHFSKGNQAGKESMDRISGSGVFGRSPDSIVIITKLEQEDVYTVEMTLRNHKRMEPFCVEFNHPLMVRNEDMDPRRLKKPGAFKEQFSPAQLMTALGNEELTTAEWETEACSLYKMSKRTFAAKKKILVDSNRSVVLGANGKWKATAPLGYTETKERDRLKENQLQTATTAIAPLQQQTSAVCATAAAAVTLTAAAVHAPTCIPF